MNRYHQERAAEIARHFGAAIAFDDRGFVYVQVFADNHRDLGRALESLGREIRDPASINGHAHRDGVDRRRGRL